MPTQEQIIGAIRQCFDPEVPVNIYDLGLIYDIKTEGEKVRVKMTLTSQHCPSAQQIPQQVRSKIEVECAIDDVEVEVVWEPAWTPELISAAGRVLLGLEGEE